MLNDVQSRRIGKYRKLANKNLFCRYIATVLLVIHVICIKFFSYNKRRFKVLGELCLIAVVFLMNTSLTPPTFAATSSEMPVLEAYTEETDIYEQADLEGMVEDTFDIVKNEEEIANLDDLIEKSKDSVQGDSVVIPDSGDRENSENESDDRIAFDKTDWKLLLVNKQHTIPEDYEFTLGTIKGSMRCDERIIEPLTQMFAAAKEDGINLVVCSPYRDLERQEFLFERKVKSYQHSGMSYMDAYKKASVTVTLPGASEHQIGLAVDIISDTYTSLNEGFADTDAGKWLAEHSWEYGFILRYPLGKEEITGIQYEPWHFRYVGTDAAEVITNQNITLEEFVENL